MKILEQKHKAKAIFVLVNQNGEYYTNFGSQITPFIELAVHFAEKHYADDYAIDFAEGFRVIKVKREESITYTEVE
jgi:hypothetical protein